MSKISRFDNERASMRIVLELMKEGASISRGQLIDRLQEYGIGRTSFYVTLNTLEDLGILEDETKNMDGKRFIVTKLTIRGRMIAEHLMDIERILEVNIH